MCGNSNWRPMDKCSNRIPQWTTLLAMLAMAALSGCALTDKATKWLRGGLSGDGDDPTVIGAPSAATYLAELYELAAGDEFRQADIYDDASSSVKLTPGPSSSLRLGLVLATPGHARSDPVRAQAVLQEVLDREELLTREEVALATIHLASAARLAGAAAETERVRDASSRAARTEERALSRRLASAEAENQRLRRELAEAEQKLDAITSIERSIREQQ